MSVLTVIMKDINRKFTNRREAELKSLDRKQSLENDLVTSSADSNVPIKFVNAGEKESPRKIRYDSKEKNRNCLKSKTAKERMDTSRSYVEYTDTPSNNPLTSKYQMIMPSIGTY